MSQLTQIEKLMSQKMDLTKLIEKAPEGEGRAFIGERLKELDELLSAFNSNECNYVNLMRFLFAKEVAEVTDSNLTLYKPKIALTYAPPQVGKTNAMIEIIKDCVLKNISVVISSDNKKDQMSQLFNRLIKSVKIHYEEIFKNCFITTVDSSNFKNIVSKMKENKCFIIFCLDNKTQIQKVFGKIQTIHKNSPLADLCLIHDEADVITKDKNIKEILSTQPESHKKWIEFTSTMYSTGIDLKRVFVTATPENVVYFYKPGFVWELSVPDNYVSSNDIDPNFIDTFDARIITRILTTEVKRRKDEGGIILYCVERNKEEVNEKNDRSNQSQVFLNILDNIKKTGLDVVSIYNSNGFKLAFRLKKHSILFENELNSNSIRYTIKDNVIDIKKNELSISEFYGYLQSCGCKMVLTIGKDLISRGISFVSNHTENPLTATTMIYRPGTQLSQVALTQAIGRLNGTAQPKLKRRLYTTEDVYSNYTTFMNNQKEIMNSISLNKKKVDDELIDEIVLRKDTRLVDRKALKLEHNMVFWEDANDEEFINDTNQIDGVKLRNLNKWINSETLVGRMINYLFTCEEHISVEEFKDEIEYTGSLEEFLSNLRGGISIKSQYGKLWNQKNNTIILNKNIRKYINTL